MKKNLFIFISIFTLVLISCSQPLVVDVEPQIKKVPIYEIIYRGCVVDEIDENDIHSFRDVIKREGLIEYKGTEYSSFELCLNNLTYCFEFYYNGRPYNYTELKIGYEFFDGLRKATSTVIQFNTKEEYENFENFIFYYGEKYIRGCYEPEFTYTEEEILHIEETYFKPIIKAFKEYVNKHCSTK